MFSFGEYLGDMCDYNRLCCSPIERKEIKELSKRTLSPEFTVALWINGEKNLKTTIRVL